jgi:hypothetical protein
MLRHLGVSFCYNSRMANQVYESATIHTIDGRVIYVTPLKIHYLRKFMDKFAEIQLVKSEDEKLELLIHSVAICLEQYCPELSSPNSVEDNFDMHSLYKIIEIAGGISFKEQKEDEKKVREQSKGSSWETLDLVALESRAFLLGIWKDYYDLETSISMPELIAILEAKTELDGADKKFLAALQGVDLDKNSGKQDEWTAMKERVFGKASGDPNDVTSFKGKKAQEAGFGIGMGLNYERIG